MSTSPKRAQPLISLVIPVLNETENIPNLIKRLEALSQVFTHRGWELQFVVNDNHSTDGSKELLESWASSSRNVDLRRFPVTVSFQTSILRGMRRATGDALVVLQSDLQDPPELIVDLVDTWLSGKRVVAAVPNNRHSSFIQDALRNRFYKILASGSKQEIIVGFQDFYLLDRDVYSEISNRNEKFQFIRGTIASEYGIDAVVPYARNLREQGKSKFSLFDKYDLAVDGLLVYSSGFIRSLGMIGFFLSFVSILGVASITILSIFGFSFGVPGWASLVSLILFALGLNMAFFSVVFEYLHRILTLQVSTKE